LGEEKRFSTIKSKMAELEEFTKNMRGRLEKGNDQSRNG